MFDPRKLMPLSIEDCSAPMAVITEITENTPIVMPIIVSAARSLFAPNEASAILMTSLNNISLAPAFRPVKLHHLASQPFQRLTSAQDSHHSYLSAATGSRRD